MLEVTNTPWHERHWYVLDARSSSPFGKALHVSPFLPMGLDYRLRTAPPGEQIAAAARRLRRSGTRSSMPTSTSIAVELTPAHAVAALVRHGTSTLKVSAAIRLQAARLWAKGAPYHRHPVPT